MALNWDGINAVSSQHIVPGVADEVFRSGSYLDHPRVREYLRDDDPQYTRSDTRPPLVSDGFYWDPANLPINEWSSTAGTVTITTTDGTGWMVASRGAVPPSAPPAEEPLVDVRRPKRIVTRVAKD